MDKVKIQISADTIVVGESPKLLLDLKNGNNYIEFDDQKIPYQKKIRVSRDLLNGKRGNVLQTAMSYYYMQACGIVAGYRKAASCRSRMNTSIREKTQSLQ